MYTEYFSVQVLLKKKCTETLIGEKILQKVFKHLLNLEFKQKKSKPNQITEILSELPNWFRNNRIFLELFTILYSNRKEYNGIFRQYRQFNLCIEYFSVQLLLQKMYRFSQYVRFKVYSTSLSNTHLFNLEFLTKKKSKHNQSNEIFSILPISVSVPVFGIFLHNIFKPKKTVFFGSIVKFFSVRYVKNTGIFRQYRSFI